MTPEPDTYYWRFYFKFCWIAKSIGTEGLKSFIEYKEKTGLFKTLFEK